MTHGLGCTCKKWGEHPVKDYALAFGVDFPECAGANKSRPGLKLSDHGWHTPSVVWERHGPLLFPFQIFQGL